MNTITASSEAPQQKHCFFLDETDEPGMATNYQKRTIYRLLCEHMEDGEARELNINQIPVVYHELSNTWSKIYTIWHIQITLIFQRSEEMQ